LFELKNESGRSLEMEPTFLRDIERIAKATPVGDQMAAMESNGIPVPQIRYLFNYKPEITNPLAQFAQELMRGNSPFSPGLRELIAAFTSSRNQCPFRIGSHAAVAVELLGDAAEVQSVLWDYSMAPVSDAEKKLFRFLGEVKQQSNQIRREEVDEARAAGWPEEALYYAISVCALFNFYNWWCDASGVQDKQAQGCQMSGHRLATEGYACPVSAQLDEGDDLPKQKPSG
jgi:uncharacterized peroxidase-related enzyme